MTWLSINPNGEPWSRKSAALALSQRWDFGLVKKIDNLSSEELANLYNNAEELGLDLYSLKRKHSKSNGEEIDD